MPLSRPGGRWSGALRWILPTLQADPALLQELLVQLLEQRPQVHAPGSAACIAVQAVVAPAGHVAFTVQDNGVGI